MVMLRTFGFKPNPAVSCAVPSAELITGRGKRDVRPRAQRCDRQHASAEFLGVHRHRVGDGHAEKGLAVEPSVVRRVVVPPTRRHVTRALASAAGRRAVTVPHLTPTPVYAGRTGMTSMQPDVPAVEPFAL